MPVFAVDLNTSFVIVSLQHGRYPLDHCERCKLRILFQIDIVGLRCLGLKLRKIHELVGILTIPCINRYPASRLCDLLLKNSDEAPFPRKATTEYFEKRFQGWARY
jgi:hypothetical protein